MSQIIIVEILVVLLVIFVLLFIGLRIRRNNKRDIREAGKKEYLTQLTPKMRPTNAPNIIIVLCDDLGYGDISCYGETPIRTPNIDALAEKGTRFTNFHSSAPVCSPSRAGVLTGRYPVRTHVPFVLFPSTLPLALVIATLYYSHGIRGLSPDEITIAEVLQKVGYRTGMLGKWHLGDRNPHLPNQFGFDFAFYTPYSNDMKPYNYFLNDQIAIKAPADQNTITKRLTEQALRFIEDSKDQPFFLHYCQPFPHNPLHASEDFQGKSEAGLYGDAVQELDWSMGEIVKTLKKHGIFDNTLIIFTSDNGPWHEGNPGYHRGRKYLPFEGGSTVPFITCWPARIKSGQENSVFSSNLDLFPTILSLLGVPLPSDRVIDGKNALDCWMGSPTLPYSSFLYFKDKKLLAIRQGKWKYHTRHQSDISAYWMIRPGPFLFDLEKDPNESYDLKTHFPDKAKEMAEELRKMRKSMKENLRGWLM